MRRARTLTLLGAAAAVLALSACGDRPQVLAKESRKSDRAAYTGGDAQFTARGWAPGEREAWEQQIRTRNQGQNEYSRSAPAPQ